MKAWGFDYKTIAFVWIKQNKRTDSLFWGMGYWTRANAELCMLATKGHPKRQSARVHQVIISHIQEHSKKPEIYLVLCCSQEQSVLAGSLGEFKSTVT